MTSEVIESVAALTELGRTRLSQHYFMRDMLYSEVSNYHGIPNLPDDPDLAVAVGQRLCEDYIEPLRATFGHVTIRSAYRSARVNGFCNQCYVDSGETDTSYYCSDNEYAAARHIWDQRDADGFKGGTVTLLIPWYLPQFEKTHDAKPLAWWIRDHLPNYAEVIFFPWLCAFNLRWYEGPNEQAIWIDDGHDELLLTDRTMENFTHDHSSEYQGFPKIGAQ